MNPNSEESVVDDSSVDFFHSSPDDVVFSILNKLQDPKSLCLSMCVCKKFRSIAPMVHDVFILIPGNTSALDLNQETQMNEEDDDSKLQPFYIPDEVLKPLSWSQPFVSVPFNFASPSFNARVFYDLNQILKPFTEIRSLHLRLREKKRSNPTTFLKWKAESGSEIHYCVVLGALSVSERSGNEEMPSLSVLAEQPKRLSFWASYTMLVVFNRLSLIQETEKHLKKIENVVVSDEMDEGLVCKCIERNQNQELGRRSDEGNDLSEFHVSFPAMEMKIWYVENLELPDSGKVMRGAALFVARSVGDEAAADGQRRNYEDMAVTAFDGEMAGEAVRKLMMKPDMVTTINSDPASASLPNV